jgi:hypothetical protein
VRMPRLMPLALSAGLIFSALMLQTVAQETPTSPPPGSAERKAILDALRARGDLHNRIFIVRYLKVRKGWAWVSADSQSPDGKNHYETESALLQKVGPGWKVVDEPCTDEGCDDKAEMARIRAANRNAPDAIFP